MYVEDFSTCAIKKRIWWGQNREPVYRQKKSIEYTFVQFHDNKDDNCSKNEIVISLYES